MTYTMSRSPGTGRVFSLTRAMKRRDTISSGQIDPRPTIHGPMSTTHNPPPTVSAVLAQLEALSDESVRARYRRQGAGSNMFGVPLGEIRKVAKGIKSNHGLAVDLWKTGNIDAQLLAILLLKPKKLSRDELDAMVRSV